MTRWPVVAVLAAVATVAAPRLLGGKQARRAAIDKTEAIASWAELQGPVEHLAEQRLLVPDHVVDRFATPARVATSSRVVPW